MSMRMGRFDHGGDMYGHEGAIDFSANINPLGMPQRVVDALRDAVESFDAYPDFACRELRAAIAQAEGVDDSWVVCTAGATDLMHRVCLALQPAEALVTAPCFSGYEQALEQEAGAGAKPVIVRHLLEGEDGFSLTESILEHPFLSADGRDADGPARLARGGKLVFLCNPNNPTGLTIPRGLLMRVLQAAEAAGAVVVVDECFLDFTDEASMVDACAGFPNLMVMKAFTKTYAMAGLRLGYGICSDATLLSRVRDAGQPWAVSAPAQVAGLAALGEAGWVQRTRDYVSGERAVLLGGLRDLGMRVIPGQANYLLFQSPVELYDPLLERGFIIRRCGNYVGLDDSWYRIAVRTATENAALLAALKEVCA